MSTWKGKERRQSYRFRLSVKVELNSADKRGEAHFLYTRDVSQGGLFLLCDDPPALGTLIQITLALPGVRPLLPVQGKVVRQELHGEKGVGVEFIDMPDAFRLLLQETLQKR